VLQVRLGPDARAVAPNLDALELDPDREAELYISDVKDRLAEAVPPRLVAEVERQVDIAKVSPGAAEAALFERFTRVLEESAHYERIVFDTAPTGQTLRLLGLPELMTVWMSGLIQRRRKVRTIGKMWRTVAGASAGEDSDHDSVLSALEDRRDRFVRARDVLVDPAQTSFLFVLTPQRLPVLETVRAVQTLQKYRIPVGGVIVNQVEPEVDGAVDAPGRRMRQAEHIESIGAEFADSRLWLVPRMDEEVVGLAVLRELCRSMSLQSVP
jgi:arsenite-transporting ATPase